MGLNQTKTNPFQPQVISNYKSTLGFDTGDENVLVAANHQPITTLLKIAINPFKNPSNMPQPQPYILSFETNGILLMEVTHSGFEFTNNNLFIEKNLITKLKLKQGKLFDNLTLNSEKGNFLFLINKNLSNKKYHAETLSHIGELIDQYKN